jgi:hypothetical protein
LLNRRVRIASLPTLWIVTRYRPRQPLGVGFAQRLIVDLVKIDIPHVVMQGCRGRRNHQGVDIPHWSIRRGPIGEEVRW